MASKVHTVSDAALNKMDAQVYAEILSQAAASADVIVFSNNTSGKAIAPRLSIKLKAGLVSGAVALPIPAKGFVVRKSVFSSKAFANIAVKTAKRSSRSIPIHLVPPAYQEQPKWPLSAQTIAHRPLKCCL